MIARIEIDFTLNEGDDLSAIMNMIGDLIVPLLDPHEEGEPCVRWVSVAAFSSVDDEYDLSLDEEDEAEIVSLLADSIGDLPMEYREGSEFN